MRYPVGLYTMVRAATAILACLLAVGCAHRPLKVVMTGDVSTRIPPDNTASRLLTRVVSGPPECGTRIAVIDVDGLLLDQNMRGYESLGENPVTLFREKLTTAGHDPAVQA